MWVINREPSFAFGLVWKWLGVVCCSCHGQIRSADYWWLLQGSEASQKLDNGSINRESHPAFPQSSFRAYDFLHNEHSMWIACCSHSVLLLCEIGELPNLGYRHAIMERIWPKVLLLVPHALVQVTSSGGRRWWEQKEKVNWVFNDNQYWDLLPVPHTNEAKMRIQSHMRAYTFSHIYVAFSHICCTAPKPDNLCSQLFGAGNY